MSYDQLKERYKDQILYYVNKYRFIYIATGIQCGLAGNKIKEKYELNAIKKI
jgi:hypothetical protein